MLFDDLMLYDALVLSGVKRILFEPSFLVALKLFDFLAFFNEMLDDVLKRRG